MIKTYFNKYLGVGVGSGGSPINSISLTNTERNLYMNEVLFDLIPCFVSLADSYICVWMQRDFCPSVELAYMSYQHVP